MKKAVIGPGDIIALALAFIIALSLVLVALDGFILYKLHHPDVEQAEVSPLEES